jgi:hypothetical protein
MMNTMAACFGYVSFPWLDIDRKQFNINFYHPESLQLLILRLAEAKPANILKSHHEFEFFSLILSAFTGVIEIVYIHRNPADVMASFWRFLHTWNWTEGPKVDTALDFAKTPPMGQLMRLQFRQQGTMLDRWANHVEHWTQPRPHIHVVRYEDLTLRYEETVRSLGTALRIEPRQIVRPSRHENVVQAGDVRFTPRPEADNREAIGALALAKFSGLMARIGYDEDSCRIG